MLVPWRHCQAPGMPGASPRGGRARRPSAGRANVVHGRNRLSFVVGFLSIEGNERKNPSGPGFTGVTKVDTGTEKFGTFSGRPFGSDKGLVHVGVFADLALGDG